MGQGVACHHKIFPLPFGRNAKIWVTRHCLFYRAAKNLVINGFLHPYSKSKGAEKIIPAANISEQISIAGKEASGTGNMKLMMNGAITLGTDDGANVEIHDAVSDDNIIIFGMKTPEVLRLRKSGYSPISYYNNNPQLREAIDFIGKTLEKGAFSDVANTFKTVDHYMALADFSDYCAAHKKADALYGDSERWNRMSLINIAYSGRFAADRSIADYARDIWNTTPLN